MRYTSVCVECGSWRLACSLHERWRCRCGHLLLKYSVIFGRTDKSNTSFESRKTLCLFACTHNNKILCFCKIMKANRMCFLPSRSVSLSAKLQNFALQSDMENIFIESEMCTFNWTVSIQIQFKWKTNILKWCNLYEICWQVHSLDA